MKSHAHGLCMCPTQVWWLKHTKWETLQEFWNHHLIKTIQNYFRETRVSRSLTVHMETKPLWRQTPSRKKKAIVFTTVKLSVYQDQLNAGFSKVCEVYVYDTLLFTVIVWTSTLHIHWTELWAWAAGVEMKWLRIFAQQFVREVAVTKPEDLDWRKVPKCWSAVH